MSNAVKSVFVVYVEPTSVGGVFVSHEEAIEYADHLNSVLPLSGKPLAAPEFRYPGQTVNVHVLRLFERYPASPVHYLYRSEVKDVLNPRHKIIFHKAYAAITARGLDSIWYAAADAKRLVRGLIQVVPVPLACDGRHYF